MAGLLDFMDSDEARFGLSLLSAAGPQAVPASFGQRMASAMSSFEAQKRAAEERQAMQAYREMQTEALRQQAAERQMKVGAQQRLQEQLMAADPSGRLALMGQLDPQGAAKMLAPQRPQVGNIDPSKFTPQSVAQFSQTGDFNVLQPAAPAPAAPAPTQLEKLQALRAQLTPDDPRLAEVNAAIRKETQFAPPASIQVGLQSPVPFQMPGGQIGYIQPPNRPGAAPQVLEVGGAPVVRPTEDGKPTEGNAKAATYLGQMQSASKLLNNIDPSGAISPVRIAAAQSPLTNFAAGQPAQQAAQAQNQWAEAFLRAKTGAAATEQEVKLNVRTFFPQPGDSQEVIAQKAQARLQAERDVMPQLGPLRRNFEQPQAQQQGQPQGQPKAQSRMVRLDDGSSVAAQLGPDGNYYVTRNGKRYRVEE